MDLDRLDRYLTGEADAEEARAAEAWLGGLDRETLLAAMKDGGDGAGEPGGDVDRAWRRLVDHLRLEERRREAGISAIRRAVSTWSLRTAAVLALLAGGWLVATRAVDAPAPSMVEIVTSPGAPSRSVLPDGTTVVLAPGAVLRAPDRFPPDGRGIELVGEAYFEVTHDPGRPFTVRSSRSRTRVLGTRFVVRDLDGEAPRVTVAEGRVAFAPLEGAGGATRPVSAGEGAVLRADGSVEVRSVSVSDAIAFTEGRLVLRDLPLDRALAEISRWYGVRARVDDPELGERRITAAFEGDDSLEAVLGAVALAAGADVRRSGDDVLFVTR